MPARKSGIPPPSSIGETCNRGAASFRYSAGQALDPAGALLASIKPSPLSYAERVPLGPIGVITPFNFPILVPCWKLAPALAFGLVGAGVPPGCVNVVPAGAETGAAVVGLAQVRGVTFTGWFEEQS